MLLYFYEFVQFSAFFVLLLNFGKCCHLFYAQPWQIAANNGDTQTLTLPRMNSQEAKKKMTTTTEFEICFSSYTHCCSMKFHFWWKFSFFFVYRCCESRRMLWMSTHYTHNKKVREIPHNTIIHFHHNHVQIIATSCFWYVIDCSY